MKEAACLIAFERPHYLRRTLESLENLEGKEDVDWHIFQDGAVNKFSGRRVARDKDVEIANKMISECDLPNKTIHENEYNEGVPLQLDKVFSLFDEYDLIHFFEDDVIVSKYGLLLHRRIVEQFPVSVPTLYHNKSVGDIDNIEDNLDIMLKSSRTSIHTFAMRKEVFREIEDEWRVFIGVMRGTDYMMRDHERIKDRLGTRHSSNDSLVAKILIDNGFYRIRPLISRALYIGMEGIHASAENYQRQFEGNIGDIHYEKDAELDEFRLEPRARYL